MFKSILAVCTLVALAACGPPKPATISSSVEIVVPADSVSAEYAAFSGLWVGTWGAALDGKIAIQTIEPDGKITGVYAWGDHPRGRFTAGSSTARVQITGNTLTLKTFGNGAVVKYTLRPDGALDGSYDLNGDVSRGIFKKKIP